MDTQLRKLQEMGGATLLVSLPKECIRAASLKKGSVLSIESSGDGGLLLYPVSDSSMPRSEKEIEISYPTAFEGGRIADQITGAYLLGYDLIKIRGKHRINSKDRESIISAVKRLIGLEVVEEDALSITSQFLVDNTAVEPRKIFKRISTIVRAMISDTILQISSESLQFESIAQRDDEVDRLHFLLVRLIRTAVRDPRVAAKFGLTAIDSLDYRVAASTLETAGDYAVELSNAFAKLPNLDAAAQKEMSLLKDALDSLQEGSTRAFIAKDYRIAQDVIDSYREFEELLERFHKEINTSKNLAELLHISDVVERIARCQRDIADLVSPMLRTE
jgi:phosphate uptake regulator